MAPTRATDSPGATRRSSPSSTGPDAAVAEPHVREARPRPPPAGRATGRAGSSTSGSVASTSSTRSRRHGRPLGLGDDHAEHPQRPDQHGDVDVERHQRAERQVAVEHLVAPDPEDHDQPQVGQQLEAGEEPGPGPGGGHRLVVDVLGLGGEAAGLDPLGAEALDDPDAGDRFLDDRGELGRLALDAHDAGEQAAREPGGEHVEERQRAEGEQGEDRVDHGQDDGHGDDGDGVGDGQRDHDHELLDLLEVGVGPAHQLSGLGLVVEREVEPLEVGEQAVAQVGLDPPGLPEGEVAAEPGEGRRGDRHGAEDEGPAPEGAGVVGDDALVDGVADQQAGADLGGRPGQADGDRESDAAAAEAGQVADQTPAPAAEGPLLVATGSVGGVAGGVRGVSVVSVPLTCALSAISPSET